VGGMMNSDKTIGELLASEYPNLVIDKVRQGNAVVHSVEMSYFTPKGKARLATKKRYSTMYFDYDAREWRHWEYHKTKKSAMAGLKIMIGD
jgi:hypothetical protein